MNAIYVRADHVVSPYSDAVYSCVTVARKTTILTTAHLSGGWKTRPCGVRSLARATFSRGRPPFFYGFGSVSRLFRGSRGDAARAKSAALTGDRPLGRASSRFGTEACRGPGTALSCVERFKRAP